MKLFLAILSYAIAAAFLAYGLLLTMHGKPALMITALVVYLAALAGFGCLPKQSH
jgi:hypothetical protein